MKLCLIGCGGVGSWLAPALCKLHGQRNLTLIDGDRLEKKNLDRQLFDETQIGKNKSAALGEKYGCEWLEAWFRAGLLELSSHDWLLVCVDNHPARLASLEECDRTGCRAIIAANETWSAEAFFYQSRWQSTPLDPRVYYPELRTSRANDPRAAAIGCTGEAQADNPQLASANLMAASLLLQLLAIWKVKAPGLTRETRGHLPYHIISSLVSFEVRKVNETLNQERTT